MDHWLSLNTPQRNSLDWTMFVDLSQPSLNGQMDLRGQALKPGVVKEMEIYNVALFWLKAHTMAGEISTSAQ